LRYDILKVTNFTSSHYNTTSRTFTAEQQDKELDIKLTVELPSILNGTIQDCLEWQEHSFNPPQVVLEQVRAYKTEMDSIAKFIEQYCRR